MIKILHLEDLQSDAELVEYELVPNLQPKAAHPLLYFRKKYLNCFTPLLKEKPFTFPGKGIGGSMFLYLATCPATEAIPGPLFVSYSTMIKEGHYH